MKTFYKSLVLPCCLAPCSVLAQDLTFTQPIVPVKVGIDQDKISAQFPFVNNTNQPITIKKIEVACDCTSAAPKNDKRIYQPGEQGVIETTMKTGNFSGVTDKTLTVTTDKGNSLLTIRADIPDLVKMDVRKLEWKKGDKLTPKVINITIQGPDPLMLKEVSLAGSDFNYNPEIIKPGREYRITITPKTTATAAFNTIWVKTDSPMPRYKKQTAFLTVK